MVQKREIPPKAELEAKFEELGYNINKLAKHYCTAWLKARGWLQTYGLIDGCRAEGEAEESIKPIELDEFVHDYYLGPAETSEVQEPDESEMPMAPEKPCTDGDFKVAIAHLQEGIDSMFDRIIERLDALEQKVDQLPTSAQVEFKDIADLAERMAKVWTDARRA